MISKSKRRRVSILVVNDDGVYGEGLRPLSRALGTLGEVTVVVPEKEQSSSSHSITLHKPIRLRRLEERFYIINGTPADCARFGSLCLLKRPPDLVVSGINRGANMGADTLYSGTVGAAREACFLGIPSIAASLAIRMGRSATSEKSWNFDAAARTVLDLARLVIRNGLPAGISLNVNVPDRPWSDLQGLTLTSLGKRIYGRDHASRRDPRGREYFWMAGHLPKGIPTPGSDLAAVRDGKVSVTPVHLDVTDRGALEFLRGWSWK